MNSYANSLFRDHHDGGRRADGDQDLQLARHDVGRPDPVQDAVLFSIGFLFQFLIAG